MNIVKVIAFCGIFAACSTTQNAPTPNTTTQNITVDKSVASVDLQPNVTLVRVNALPLLLTSRMVIDGKEVTRLKNKQYSRVYIAPGAHVLKVAYAPLSFQAGTSKDIFIEPDENYVFEVTSNLPIGVVGGNVYSNVSVHINEHSSGSSNIDLSFCCEDVTGQNK